MAEGILPRRWKSQACERQHHGQRLHDDADAGAGEAAGRKKRLEAGDSAADQASDREGIATAPRSILMIPLAMLTSSMTANIAGSPEMSIGVVTRIGTKSMRSAAQSRLRDSQTGCGCGERGRFGADAAGSVGGGFGSRCAFHPSLIPILDGSRTRGAAIQMYTTASHCCSDRPCAALSTSTGTESRGA